MSDKSLIESISEIPNTVISIIQEPLQPPFLIIFSILLVFLIIALTFDNKIYGITISIIALFITFVLPITTVHITYRNAGNGAGIGASIMSLFSFILTAIIMSSIMSNLRSLGQVTETI